jgi:hypothetical protein
MAPFCISVESSVFNLHLRIVIEYTGNIITHHVMYCLLVIKINKYYRLSLMRVYLHDVSGVHLN